MPRLTCLPCVLFLAVVLLFALCPDKICAGETGEEAGGAESEEPSVESEGEEEGEGEEKEEEEPLTLESLKKKFDELEKKMKEKGVQTPGSEKITLKGSVRVRHARLENRDFTFEFDDRVDATLLRSRLGFDARVTEMVGCFIEVEDSRFFGQALDPIYATAHEADTFDLLQGYVRLNFFKHEDGGNESGFYIGRQEIKLGDERMVGNWDWNNIGRTFDAVRLHWENKKHHIDTWYATMDETARRSRDTEFAGAYYSYRAVEDQEFDVYFMHRRDGDRATETEVTETWNTWVPGPPVAPYMSNLIIETIGARADGKIPSEGVAFPYNAEFIWQWGHWGPDRVKAWAVATRIGVEIDTEWKPTFFLVYNIASGDSKPFDRVHETPQTPYPTNHGHYGTMDMFSWRNMRQIGFRARVTPLKDKDKNQEMYFEAGYYTFHLAESTDAWYGASGNIFAEVNPYGPHVNTHVGEELDFVFMWKIAKWSNISAGFNIFYPRDYVRYALIGHPDNMVFFFVQFLVKF